MDRFKIGALAERTGTNAPTIRYYEAIGLLRAAERQRGGQRIYADTDLRRLTFIRRCREFGFSIEQVRSLVGLLENREHSCMHARDLAQEHLMAVRAKLDELKALERSITAFVKSCDSTCTGGPAQDCPIVADLSTAPARRSG
jgi:DNA-binding transcriptional MerR regulator